jgi:hypothetical protein
MPCHLTTTWSPDCGRRAPHSTSLAKVGLVAAGPPCDYETYCQDGGKPFNTQHKTMQLLARVRHNLNRPSLCVASGQLRPLPT